MTVATRLPRRRHPSARRTVSFEAAPAPGWEHGVSVDARARDIVVPGMDVVPGPPGRSGVLAQEQWQLHLDGQGRLLALTGQVSDRLRDSMVGRRARTGFRARLTAAHAAGALDPAGLATALLDDLPTLNLINGYARLMDMEQPPPPPSRRSPSLGVCAGWRPQGTAVRRVELGERLLGAAPVAPELTSILDDPLDFHAESPRRPGTMRRRRILEVAPEGDGLAVLVYLRDSYVDPSGSESALHEYLVECRLVPPGYVVTDLRVDPRALPFPDCPLAVPSVSGLVGMPAGDAADAVPARLTGVDSCTHLNDVLRFLRFAPYLAGQARLGVSGG